MYNFEKYRTKYIIGGQLQRIHFSSLYLNLLLSRMKSLNRCLTSLTSMAVYGSLNLTKNKPVWGWDRSLHTQGSQCLPTHNKFQLERSKPSQSSLGTFSSLLHCSWFITCLLGVALSLIAFSVPFYLQTLPHLSLVFLKCTSFPAPCCAPWGFWAWTILVGSPWGRLLRGKQWRVALFHKWLFQSYITLTRALESRTLKTFVTLLDH